MRNTRVVCFIFVYNMYVVESFQITHHEKMEAKDSQPEMLSSLRSDEGITNATVLPGAASSDSHITTTQNNDTSFKTRVKRESKLQGAAKTSNLKTMHTFFQLIRNFWSPTPLGGSHPLHPDTVKPVMRIFRAGVYDFLFPPASKTEEI